MTLRGDDQGHSNHVSRRGALLTLASFAFFGAACRDYAVDFGIEKAEAEAGTPAADGHLLSRLPKAAPPVP